MGRSSRHQEKHGRNSEISKDSFLEGTAARTRPISFDEIMSKRKKKKLSENEKDEASKDVSGDGIVEKVSDFHGSERGNAHGKDSSPQVREHSSGKHTKASPRKKEDTSLMKGDGSNKVKERRNRDSEIKLKVISEVKGRNDEKFHGSKIGDERPRNGSENEVAKKHRSSAIQKDRHMDKSGGKSGKESKKRHGNVDDNNRQRSDARRHDLVKGRDIETLERKERKEVSESHREEARMKRRRSRSRENWDRHRRALSPSPRAHKRASKYAGEHVELSSRSQLGTSERRYSDISSNQNTNNGSNSHYRGRGSGFKSGLGGYSPRKRRSEAAVKTPSPAKRSPEKKSAKWDLAPEGVDHKFYASVPSNSQPSNQMTTSNINKVLSAVTVAPALLKPVSGVLPSTLSTNKISIDSIQLTQATRPMRRLYVENVPASASEKSVMECINNFLVSSGVNHVQGTQPCISCIMHKDKGQALIEFLTPEDASAALSFDGSSFSGSIIKIRRPKDFIEVATGELEKSVAVDDLMEKHVAAVDTISNIVWDSPHKIFIGGIPKVLSSEMLMDIAKAFGPLKAYQFEMNEDLRDSYAFVEYVDPSVTSKACAGLNGMKFGGKVIAAVQAISNLSSLESSGNLPFSGIPEFAKPLLEEPTQVLKLKNLIDPEALSSLSCSEINEVLEDVRLECTRFGTVKSVNIVKDNGSPTLSTEAGNVGDGMASSGAEESLNCDETSAKTEMLNEALEHKAAEGNSDDGDNIAGDLVEDKPLQPCHFDNDTTVEDEASKARSDSQHLSQQCESELNDGKVTGKIHTVDFIVENKLCAEEELNLEEVSGASKEASLDDSVQMESKAVEKEDGEERDCHLGHIFEIGCVFVEFGRTEASCMAAHCLHGRLFDNHIVMVEYVPLEIYRRRFPK